MAKRQTETFFFALGSSALRTGSGLRRLYLVLFKSMWTPALSQNFILSRTLWTSCEMLPSLLEKKMMMPVLMRPKSMNWYVLRQLYDICPIGVQICHQNLSKLLFFQVPNFEFLSEKLMMYQTQHNEIVRGSSLDLVFFTDAMTHLVKVRLTAN